MSKQTLKRIAKELLTKKGRQNTHNLRDLVNKRLKRGTTARSLGNILKQFPDEFIVVDSDWITHGTSGKHKIPVWEVA